MDRQQSGTSPQAGTGGQNGSTHFTITACNQKCVTIVALVAFRGAICKEREIIYRIHSVKYLLGKGKH